MQGCNLVGFAGPDNADVLGIANVHAGLKSGAYTSMRQRRQRRAEIFALSPIRPLPSSRSNLVPDQIRGYCEVLLRPAFAVGFGHELINGLGQRELDAETLSQIESQT